MAPGNNERHPGHTGTIPKTKVRNNCNVPQEAVTPTRRDMTSNLVTVRGTFISSKVAYKKLKPRQKIPCQTCLNKICQKWKK